MKYLNSYRLFESFDIDYVGLILSNLSDTSPELLSKYLNDNILLYDLNIKGDDYNDEEMSESIGRLEDEGWTLLNISKDHYGFDRDGFNRVSFICSIIRIDFLNKLKSSKIILWDDLSWKEWHLNKHTSSNCLHSKFKTDNGEISIIDGTKGGPNQIDWIEILNQDEDFRFSNLVEAEIFLIEIQYK